jgi:hypothetical protein
MAVLHKSDRLSRRRRANEFFASGHTPSPFWLLRLQDGSNARGAKPMDQSVQPPSRRSLGSRFDRRRNAAGRPSCRTWRNLAAAMRSARKCRKPFRGSPQAASILLSSRRQGMIGQISRTVLAELVQTVDLNSATFHPKHGARLCRPLKIARSLCWPASKNCLR